MDKKCCNPACEKEAALTCSSCRSVQYCSKDHQRAHWPVHKLNCKSCKEEWDILIGSHIVASKNLNPGDVIVQEAPLVLGFAKEHEEPKVICIGCCSSLGVNQGAKTCPKCNWPMCGDAECWGEGSAHSFGECALLKEAGSRVTVGDPRSGSVDVYYAIMVLRCLSLRQRDPKKWKKLLKFRDCKSVIELNRFGKVAHLVKRWIAGSTIIIAVSQETITKLCRVYFVNSLFLEPIPGRISEGFCGIYAVTSLVEQNSVGNATRALTKDGQMVVRATVPISMGARISINTFEPLKATLERRFDLFVSKFYFCQCERCKDPTELGTYTGGIYCPDCPDQQGILLSENPLDSRSDWICNKCSGRKTTKRFLEGLLETVGKDSEGVDLKSVSECEAFIQKYSKILHPHNSYLTEVKFTLMDLYGRINKGKLTDALVRKTEPVVNELLGIANIISPGLSRLRCALLSRLYYLKIAEMIGMLRKRDRDAAANGELITHIKALRTLLEELLQMLKFEAEETMGGADYKTFSDYLAKTDDLRAKLMENPEYFV